VSVKRNPGKSTHKEVGHTDYVNLKPAPRRAGGAPIAKDGKPHTLEAEVSKLDEKTYELR